MIVGAVAVMGETIDRLRSRGHVGRQRLVWNCSGREVAGRRSRNRKKGCWDYLGQGQARRCRLCSWGSALEKVGRYCCGMEGS